MTLKEQLDEIVQQALERTDEILTEHGATDDEREAELAIQRVGLAVWREQVEAEVKRSIDEPEAPTTRLQ